MVCEALTDLQIKKLLAFVKGTPLYAFVMLGLYAGLCQGEILALQWDCVFLDCERPYLSVRRVLRAEYGKPVVSSELKSPAAKREVFLPKLLVDCLREAKQTSSSPFVVANADSGPLSFVQLRQLWQTIDDNTFIRAGKRKEKGKKSTKAVISESGTEPSRQVEENSKFDFRVTPHMLRHTYMLSRRVNIEH